MLFEKNFKFWPKKMVRFVRFGRFLVPGSIPAAEEVGKAVRVRFARDFESHHATLMTKIGALVQYLRVDALFLEKKGHGFDSRCGNRKSSAEIAV